MRVAACVRKAWRAPLEAARPWEAAIARTGFPEALPFLRAGPGISEPAGNGTGRASGSAPFCQL